MDIENKSESFLNIISHVYKKNPLQKKVIQNVIFTKGNLVDAVIY